MKPFLDLRPNLLNPSNGYAPDIRHISNFFSKKRIISADIISQGKQNSVPDHPLGPSLGCHTNSKVRICNLHAGLFDLALTLGPTLIATKLITLTVCFSWVVWLRVIAGSDVLRFGGLLEGTILTF